MKEPVDNIRVSFGMRLEAMRRHYGAQSGRPRLSRSEFAEELGLERARYARYERGETEPPLQVLEMLRRITGLSLDWLIAGVSIGAEPQAGNITLGDRLRWARETQEPWLHACAAVMNVKPLLWQAYEEDRSPLPVETATEFAHRFSVTLDYLYRGVLEGIATSVREALLKAHPELRATGNPSHDGYGHAPGTFPVPRSSSSRTRSADREADATCPD